MNEPLVAIVTPVYNGERYLVECIESVLQQTYQNWEYTLVNNCSTDKTLEIVNQFVNKDKRIKVVTNPHFVSLIENHNIAFGLISKNSKYCKLLSADDWMFPDFIAKLVELGEKEPTAGIIGAYSINNAYGVRWSKIPLEKSLIDGRELCRHYFLNNIDAFWTPSSVLYRSELVLKNNPFFPGDSPSADLAACLIYLQSWNFGFCHQILSFERIHEEATNSKLRDFNSFLVDRIEFLKDYGNFYLQPEEIEHRMAALFKEYHNCLAIGFVNFRNTEFWQFHRGRLKQLGYPFLSIGLGKAIGMKLLDLIFNPKQTLEKLAGRIKH